MNDPFAPADDHCDCPPSDDPLGPYAAGVHAVLEEIEALPASAIRHIATIAEREDDLFEIYNEAVRAQARAAGHLRGTTALEVTLAQSLLYACEAEGLATAERNRLTASASHALVTPVVFAALGPGHVQPVLVGFVGAFWALVFGGDLLEILSEAEGEEGLAELDGELLA
jgi:hypothetical protein